MSIGRFGGVVANYGVWLYRDALHRLGGLAWTPQTMHWKRKKCDFFERGAESEVQQRK